MKQESLDKAVPAIIESISNADIDQVDKVELLLNVRKWLINKASYERGLRALQREEYEHRFDIGDESQKHL